MLGYLIGDLAGSPYRRFNKFELGESFQFFSPYVFMIGRRGERDRQTRFSEVTTEVAPSQAFLVSAAMSRFMMDTRDRPARRTDASAMRGALEFFAEDYGVDFPFDARLLPSAAVVIMYSAKDREDMRSIVGTLCDCSEVSDSDRRALVAFADGLWELNHGSLEDMDRFLKENHPEFVEVLGTEEFRQRGSSLQVQDLYIGEDSPEVNISRDLALSVLAGLKAATEGTSFEDCLRRAISLGGDTQVVAAVAGALADCRFRGVEAEESMGRLGEFAEQYVPRDFSKTLDTFERNYAGSARLLIADVQEKDKEYGLQHEVASESGAQAVAHEQVFMNESREVRTLPYPRVQVLRGKDGGRKYYVPAWNERTEAQFAGLVVPPMGGGAVKEPEFYVSYYGSKVRPKDAFLVQISNTRPSGVEVAVEFESVYPGDIVKQHKEGVIDDAGYTESYRKLMEENKSKILSGIEQIKAMAREEGKDVYFVCYEKPGEFCHRYLLNNFLIENGITCRENPAERDSYLIGAIEAKEPEISVVEKSEAQKSYDNFVARMEARFGKDNVVVGGDIRKDFDAAYKAWQRPGETFLDGQAPEILNRYFVVDASVRERDPKGKLVTVLKDSVLPIWSLDKEFYRSGDIAGLLEWKAWKDYGNVAEAQRQLKEAKEDLAKMRDGWTVELEGGRKELRVKDWPSYNMQKELVSKLELAVIALEKGKKFPDYVLSCYEKYGSADRAHQVALFAKKESEGSPDRKKIFSEKYYPAFEAARVLAAVEDRIPFAVRKAVESKAVLDAVRAHVEYGLYEGFVRKPDGSNSVSFKEFLALPLADDVRQLASAVGKVYVGSNDSSLGILSPCSPVCGVDYLGVRNGDDMVGSVEVSALTGSLLFNRQVQEGVTQNYGHLSATAMQEDYSRQDKTTEWAPKHYAGAEEKIADLCRQFDSIVYDNRDFGDVKRERDDYLDAVGRASPYDSGIRNNFEKYAFCFESSEDHNVVALRENIDRLRSIRASERQVKM